MSIKSFAIAATVAAGRLCTADQADAQWRRGRATYNTYSYPSYSYSYPNYSYTPGVVYSSYSTPYYTSGDGVIVSGYSTPYTTSSYYTSPYSGSYYNTPYNSWGNNNWGLNNWGYNNVYSTGYGGIGTRGAAFGPYRVRW